MKKTSAPKNPDVKIVEKIVVDSPTAELVCMTPQGDNAEGSPAPVLVAAVPAEETVLMASLVTGDLEVVSQASSSATSLVEAIPHYRSNPLPEYPRLARKKNIGRVWSGFWLMSLSMDPLMIWRSKKNLWPQGP